MKISSKRPFDCLQNSPPSSCSPHKITFLDSPPQNIKKRKTEQFQPIIEDDDKKLVQSDTSQYLDHHNVDQTLLEWIPKYKRVKYQASKPSEKIFNSIDVRMILAKAIEETKLMLKEEYERALQQRLAEQFQQFSSYTQDNIHRQVNGHNYDYMT